MTRDDVAKIANELGWQEVGCDLWGGSFSGAMTTEALLKFARQVIADKSQATPTLETTSTHRCKTVAAPLGYKLVPEDPTEEMCYAASNVRRPYNGHPDTWSPSYVDTYKAMVAAAPSAPQGHTVNTRRRHDA